MTVEFQFRSWRPAMAERQRDRDGGGGLDGRLQREAAHSQPPTGDVHRGGGQKQQQEIAVPQVSLSDWRRRRRRLRRRRRRNEEKEPAGDRVQDQHCRRVSRGVGCSGRGKGKEEVRYCLLHYHNNLMDGGGNDLSPLCFLRFASLD